MSTGVPYTFNHQFVLDPGDEQACILLKVPSRGYIRKLVISQEVGSLDGFDFEIFTNRAVCPPDVSQGVGSTSSSSSAGSTPAEELYSVFGQKTAAGKVFSEFQTDYIYECEGGSTNKKRELYMRFTPDTGDSGLKEFHMAMMIEQTKVS
jgi:hypothetical protein